MAGWLVAQKVDGIRIKGDLHGKGPEYVLRDAGVFLHHTDASTLNDVQLRNERKERP